jgi:DNA-directed RNA polymerase specialized sigma24 family protein
VLKTTGSAFVQGCKPFFHGPVAAPRIPFCSHSHMKKGEAEARFHNRKRIEHRNFPPNRAFNKLPGYALIAATARKGARKMGVADRIASQLPFLRRFARALTGTQSGGDAYVAALLEAVIADPSMIEDEADARIALYRTLCKLWASLRINNVTDTPTQWEKSAQRHLTAVPPRARQAFLLTGLEGFSLDQAARILDTDSGEIARLIDEAAAEIALQVRTDVLIIEDEPLIAMDLKKLVEDLGHRVSGIARTRQQAVHLAARSNPGLVLADIQLADESSGIDAINEILTTMEVPVIFITAFPERLLTGQRPEPAFLVTKPYVPDMLKAIIGQALFFDTRAQSPAKVAAV